MRWMIAMAALMAASPAVADTLVDGYFRKDGTYVAPHYRSDNDGQRWNNYSSQGNQNPYTGQKGTQDPYPAPSYGSKSLNDLNKYRPRY